MEIVDGGTVPVRAGYDAHGLFLDIGDSVRVRLPDGWLDATGFHRRVEVASWAVRELEQARPPVSLTPVPGAPGTDGWT